MNVSQNIMVIIIAIRYHEGKFLLWYLDDRNNQVSAVDVPTIY